MNYFFANSKIFRLHAILHDSAGTVKSTTQKGPGYCSNTKLFAQISANFHVFRGHAKQRGRGFGALAQTLGRTAIPFIKNHIVHATKKRFI